MNYSKGFTRIWFALSLSWIIGVASYHFDDINNPKIDVYSYLYNPQAKSYIDISGEAELIRKLTKDKNYDTYKTPYSESYIYSVAERKTAIEIMVAASLQDDVSIRKSQYDAARTSAIWRTVIYAAAPVIAFLMIGFFIIWVAAGFKRTKPQKPRW